MHRWQSHHCVVFHKLLCDFDSMASRMFRVAVTQHEPVGLNLQATTDKTCRIIEEAASRGAKLVTFPECWVRTQMPSPVI